MFRRLRCRIAGGLRRWVSARIIHYLQYWHYHTITENKRKEKTQNHNRRSLNFPNRDTRNGSHPVYRDTYTLYSLPEWKSRFRGLIHVSLLYWRIIMVLMGEGGEIRTVHKCVYLGVYASETNAFKFSGKTTRWKMWSNVRKKGGKNLAISINQEKKPFDGGDGSLTRRRRRGYKLAPRVSLKIYEWRHRYLLTHAHQI